jgi:regulator of cell morphogenesis and NO signaling
MESTMPTVSEMVRKDYRAADIFKKWGINYCCGGNLPLEQVCSLQGLDQAAIEAELSQAAQLRRLPPSVDYDNWPLPFLIDYVQLLHHSYARVSGGQLQQQLSSFVSGHIKKYPYLVEVEEAYQTLLTLLLEHMQDEETRIFPYLRQLCGAYANINTYGKLFIRTLGRPLDSVESDHNRIAAALKSLRALTNNYRFAEGACTNHQVLYHKLREFDADLVQHKHLENNVLFPRVRAMEKELQAL